MSNDYMSKKVIYNTYESIQQVIEYLFMGGNKDADNNYALPEPPGFGGSDIIILDVPENSGDVFNIVLHRTSGNNYSVGPLIGKPINVISTKRIKININNESYKVVGTNFKDTITFCNIYFYIDIDDTTYQWSNTGNFNFINCSIHQPRRFSSGYLRYFHFCTSSPIFIKSYFNSSQHCGNNSVYISSFLNRYIIKVTQYLFSTLVVDNSVMIDLINYNFDNNPMTPDLKMSNSLYLVIKETIGGLTLDYDCSFIFHDLYLNFIVNSILPFYKLNRYISVEYSFVNRKFYDLDTNSFITCLTGLTAFELPITEVIFEGSNVKLNILPNDNWKNLYYMGMPKHIGNINAYAIKYPDERDVLKGVIYGVNPARIGTMESPLVKQVLNDVEFGVIEDEDNVLIGEFDYNKYMKEITLNIIEPTQLIEEQ